MKEKSFLHNLIFFSDQFFLNLEFFLFKSLQRYLQSCMRRIMDKWIALEEKYSPHTYRSIPIVLTRGKGAWVWDNHGKKYLDLIGGYSSINYGHAHPKLIKTLTNQAKKISLTLQLIYNEKLGLFLSELCKFSGMERAMPVNSGGEAVEAAIKAARRWGYKYKAIPENRAEIIVAEENYHGRTVTLISASTRDKYRDEYGPFTPGFKKIPFGSAEALERAITSNTCAFLVETMQGEAGIKIPPKGWLKAVAKICKDHHILLILDEVQVGLGRTGKNFAFQHEKVKPDGLILGKSLGGGLVPSACFLAKKEVMDVFGIGGHGSTFGGNPLAAAVGYEALQLLKQEKLAEKSRVLGEYFLKELKKIDSPFILDIRGKGLWIGMDINPRKIPAAHLCDALIERGILCKETHELTIRIIPPLVIEKKDIDWAVHQIREVLEMGPLPLRKRRHRT